MKTILLMLVLFSVFPITGGYYFATCTGADPCRACKNCRACKHCHKDGGTCGVCKK